MTTMHWRWALGACMLSAALLVGGTGGAIAAADTDSGGLTAEDQGGVGSTQIVSPASEAVEGTADTNTSDSVSNASQEVSAGPAGPMTMGTGSTDPQEPAPTGTNEAGATITEQAREGSVSTTAVTTEVASDPAVVVSHSQVVVPPPTVVTSKAPRWTAAERRAAVRTALAPVRAAVATARAAVIAIPGVIMSLPTSPTPVTDVITAVQDLLTSVGAVGVSLARAPSDLASLLGFPGMAPGAFAGKAPGGIGTGLFGLPAAVDVPVLSSGAPQSPLTLFASDVWAEVAGQSTMGRVVATGSSHELSVSGVASIAKGGVASTGVPTIVKHTILAVLLPVSLMALAAVALPGVGGLLAASGAGTMVGYRQAKAASTLPAVGIARFVKSGPVGVVRSGSLVTLRPRASRVVPRQPSTAESPLKTVA